MSLVKDFRNFAFKGNLIDLAVGFVIGGAFSGIVTAMVNDLIMPAISLLTPKQGYTKWAIAGGKIKIGLFLAAILNFFIVAVSLFVVVVVVIEQIKKLTTKPAPAAAPTTKACPYCLSTIPLAATKCAQCTSSLPPEVPAVA